MKKALGIILALALIMTMAVPASAIVCPNEDIALESDSGEDTVEDDTAESNVDNGSKLEELFFSILDKLGLEGTALYEKLTENLSESALIGKIAFLVLLVLLFLPLYPFTPLLGWLGIN